MSTFVLLYSFASQKNGIQPHEQSKVVNWVYIDINLYDGVMYSGE